MASPRHFGPALNVVSTFNPAPWRERRFFGETCDRAGYTHVVVLLELKGHLFRLIVQAAGGVNGFGHPVEGYVAQQLVLAEATFHVAITVCPVPKFFDDPGGKRDWRVIQAVGSGLGRVSLQVRIGAPVNVPAVRVIEKLLPAVVRFRAWLQVRPVRSG